MAPPTTTRNADNRPEPDSRVARNRLVESQLRLADRIARDYRRKGVELDDLRQVAYLALVRAAARYDASRGTRFSVFASVSINGALKRYFRDHGWSVRPPRSIQELSLHARSARDRMTQRLARTPSVDELAADVEADPEDVRAGLGVAYRAESIDASPIGSSPGREPVDDDPVFDRAGDRIDVARLVEPLTARQRHIVDLRFGQELTQSSIAERIGISQVQVSRLLQRIVDTLRERTDQSS